MENAKTNGADATPGERPDTIPVPDRDPVDIEWLTRHVGCAVIPHPELVGRAAFALVLANYSDPSDCKLLLPQGPEMMTMLSIAAQLAIDVRDMENRVSALELGVRLAT